ncbi:hypothetical protein PYCC9005_003067 [Savitreella phatthalungensis]
MNGLLRSRREALGAIMLGTSRVLFRRSCVKLPGRCQHTAATAGVRNIRAVLFGHDNCALCLRAKAALTSVAESHRVCQVKRSSRIVDWRYVNINGVDTATEHENAMAAYWREFYVFDVPVIHFYDAYLPDGRLSGETATRQEVPLLDKAADAAWRKGRIMHHIGESEILKALDDLEV